MLMRLTTTMGGIIAIIPGAIKAVEPRVGEGNVAGSMIRLGTGGVVYVREDLDTIDAKLRAYYHEFFRVSSAAAIKAAEEARERELARIERM